MKSPASEFRVEEVRFMKIVVQHVTDDDLRLQLSQLEEELFPSRRIPKLLNCATQVITIAMKTLRLRPFIVQ